MRPHRGPPFGRHDGRHGDPREFWAKMEPRERRRFRNSLLLKLLLVLFVAGCLVNLLVGGFFRLVFGRESHALLEHNIIRYAHYLASDIGSPPDTARARALAAEGGLKIRIEGPAGAWESHPGMIFPVKEFRRGRHPEPGDSLAAVGWYRGAFIVRVLGAAREKAAPAETPAQQPGVPGGTSVGARPDSSLRSGAPAATLPPGVAPETRYYFALDVHSIAAAGRGHLGMLIGLCSAVLAVAFVAMRRVLYPLRYLTAAVERLGKGELGHQVPVWRGRDELVQLSRAFNAMSTRLKEMVASREQLLLDVSHELRSPLTRLKVALEMAPDGMAKESMRGDLSEMDAMIGEILEAARMDSAHGRLNLEETDLRALAEEAARLFQGRAPGVSIQSGARPRLRVDRERVRKVIANLLDNALKYSRDQALAVEMEIAQGNSQVTLKVRDRGAGIPEGEIPRLFEPFYRIDRSRSRDTGGYGLGLSLCKRIMEAHGGRIEIASRGPEGSGAGTEVTLVFTADAGASA